jgi:hypothetical protein
MSPLAVIFAQCFGNAAEQDMASVGLLSLHEKSVVSPGGLFDDRITFDCCFRF